MPKILMRRDTAANWTSANPTLASGEWALETDTGKMKLGDGTTAYNTLSYYTKEDDEWTKPSDWPDIRSGAKDNSVYFLVGHSEDYSKYNTFKLRCYINIASSSAFYDVYIDGKKLFTTLSIQDTDIVWSDLNLETGKLVSYPENLKVHIIRCTPSKKTDILTSGRIRIGSSGCLWIHFTNEEIRSGNTLPGASNPQYLLEAITAKTGKLVSDYMYSSFSGGVSLKTVPTLETDTIDGYFSKDGMAAAYMNCKTLKKIRLTHIEESIANVQFSTQQMFDGCSNLETIEFDGKIIPSGRMFYNCGKLKSLPPLDFEKGSGNIFTNITHLFHACANLDPFSVEIRNKNMERFHSDETFRLKGLTVSSEAPFSSTTSPQIDIHGTGLDRSALVNLFNSMPYCVGYTVVGSPTIVDGVASGFSASDYLSTSSLVPAVSNFEFNCKFTTGTAFTGETYTLFAYSNLRIGYTQEGYIGCRIPKNGTYATFQLSHSIVLTTNTTYIEKVTYNGNSLTLSIYDANNQLISSQSWQDDSLQLENGVISIGRAGTASFIKNGGSIDLNETYIKINGHRWSAFDGVQRTCSIVGCTGTSSLTQEDKDIVLNKGWALTTS